MDRGMYRASRLSRTVTISVKSGILKIIDIAVVALASLTLSGRVINVRFSTTFL